jgi:hypothetical protein
MVFNNNLLLGAAGAAGGYTIDYSARFNSGDSAYMYRTLAGDGSTTTTTVSFWVKRNKLGTTQGIISGYNSTGPAEACFRFNGDQIQYFDNNGISLGNFITNAVFRDVSKPYHIVFIRDTTNGTAASRLRLIVNGTEITSWASRTDPTASEATLYFMRAAYPQRIGHTNSSPNYSDFTLSEFHLIDGLVKEASEFGETDAVTGQWVPKAYTGTYGSEGFYLDFADSGALGTDVSGNANTFTTSGLTSADQLTDTPTDNYATFNAIRTGQTGITLTDGALQASAGAAGTRAVAAGIPIDSETTTGYYAEIKITALAFASPSFFGLVTPEFVIGATAMYASSGAYVYNDSAGATYANGVAGATYTPIVLNDVVQFAVKNGNVYVGINNTWVNSGDPVAETGAVWTGLSGLYSFCWEYSRGGAGTNTHTVVADFGQSGFAYTPPTGYSGVSTATLPDPTIADPSAYFQATAYAGSASALEVNQSGNSTFQPDFIWIKQRTDAGTNHQLVDAVRGENLRLESDNTDAEGDVGAGGITSFDADGFSVGTNSNYNAASKNFIAWQWKADNTSGSSNTDGSITSTVAANTTAGFSICTTSGSGGAGTFGHGLGVAPSLIIPFRRTDADSRWVFHQALGPTKGIPLNSTDTATTSVNFWNNTSPTSSIVNVGNTLNNSGDTYVFYCFAEVEGYSKAFNITSVADGSFIYLGFLPRWVLFKRTDSTTDWILWDSTRSTYNPMDRVVYADLSNAEDTTGSYRMDAVSNGLVVRYSITGAWIGMAFAESPFKTANAR